MTDQTVWPYSCDTCGKNCPFHRCFDCLIAAMPFKVGDTVKVTRTGKTGTVSYLYYNGFALVDTGDEVVGGMFNNDSTYRIKELEKA